MGGLTKEIEFIGFVRLLDADITLPILNVDQYIEQLKKIEESSACSNIRHRQESELYFSNLRLQTNRIIHIIISKVDQPVIVKNEVSEHSFNFDSNLFGFVLSKLLQFVLKCFMVSELEVSCFNVKNEITITLSAKKKTVFNGLNRIYNNKSSELALSETDITLMLCYDILSFYGGNLWSQGSAQMGLKICFSMPVKKKC